MRCGDDTPKDTLPLTVIFPVKVIDFEDVPCKVKAEAAPASDEISPLKVEEFEGIEIVWLPFPRKILFDIVVTSDRFTVSVPELIVILLLAEMLPVVPLLPIISVPALMVVFPV